MVKTSRVVFWDVDTQVDFMLPDGMLYVKGAEDLINNLERLTKYARTQGIRVLGSVDYHTYSDKEISNRPNHIETFQPHCIINTEGQSKIDATKPKNPLWIDYTEYVEKDLERRVRAHKGEIYFRKNVFDVFLNPNTEKVLAILNPKYIILYGVTLDICDAYTIEGLLARGYIMYLVSDAVQPINSAKADELVKKWAKRGLKLVNTSYIVEGHLKSNMVE